MDSKTLKTYSIVIGTTKKSLKQLISERLDHILTIAEAGTWGGGSFTVDVNTVTSGTIAFDATAAAVKTALDAIAGVIAGKIEATGGPLPGTDVIIKFHRMGLVTLAVDDSGLTGTTPTIATPIDTQLGRDALPANSSLPLISVRPSGAGITFSDQEQIDGIAIADGIEKQLQVEDALSNLFFWSGGTVTTEFILSFATSDLD